MGPVVFLTISGGAGGFSGKRRCPRALRTCMHASDTRRHGVTKRRRAFNKIKYVLRRIETGTN